MRRIILATAVLAALAGAAVACAGTTQNTYTAGFTFHQSGAGTPKKPVPVGITETLGAANATPGMRAAPLIDLKFTLGGLKINQGPFPTCSEAKILAAKSDTGCPKGAEVATGTVRAALGDDTLAGPGTPCTPLLDVWNAGHGHLLFFFVLEGTHQCGGLQTGAAAPWLGSARTKGGTLVIDTPLPPDVSTDAGNIGAYGSLQAETLHWFKLTKKVGHKVIPFIASTGCSHGARRFTVSYTATDAAAETLTSSVTGSGKC